MLVVDIKINDRHLDRIMIGNISENYGVGKQKYLVFDERMEKRLDIPVEHNYSDGYLVLIKKVAKLLSIYDKKPKGNIQKKKK